MQKFKIELLAPAWQELDEIAQMHLSLVGAKSAEQITTKLLDAIENLSTSPYMGKSIEESLLRDEGYRRIVCGNYLCFYKVIGQTVYVYHIVDGRRNYPKLFEETEI